MNKGFLQDSEGNMSSKRLAGFMLIFFGIVMALILFYRSLYFPIANSQTALDIICYFLSIGGGLLGIGVFENIKIGRNNDN
jgi:hypothetical protein